MFQSETTAALRRIPVYLVDAVDGVTPQTGLTFLAAEVQLSKNGGAFANAAGAVTEVGSGAYYYQATQAETDTLGYLMIKIAKTGVRPFVDDVPITLRPSDHVIEGTFTELQLLRLMASVLLAKATGLTATGPVFRDLEDTKNRVTASVVDGVRSAVTLDPT